MAGGVNTGIFYAGLTPGLVGLFQINIQVPGSLPSGEHDVVVTVDEALAPAGANTAGQIASVVAGGG